MSGVKGDIGALTRIAERVKRTAIVNELTAERAAEPLTGIMQGDFAAQRSPTGVPWGTPYDLYESGALKASLTFEQAGTRLKVAGLPGYARYQDPRRFIPASGTKLPATYRATVDAVSEQAFRDLAEGRA